MEDKIEFIDDFLMRCEDWMHGQDGNDVTICRKYINEIRDQVKNCSIPDVVRSVFTIHSTEYEGIIKIVGTEQDAKQQVEEFKKQHNYADFFYEKQNIS